MADPKDEQKPAEQPKAKAESKSETTNNTSPVTGRNLGTMEAGGDVGQLATTPAIGAAYATVDPDKKYKDPNKESSTKPGTAAAARQVELNQQEELRAKAAKGEISFVV